MAMHLSYLGFTSSTVISAAVFVFAVLLYAIHIIRQKKASHNFEAKFPPGPGGWPVVGNLASIGKKGWIEKQAEIYGDMFTLHMGSLRMIYLGGKTLKDALTNGHLLSERTPAPAFFDYFKNTGIVGASFHKDWKEQRGFVVRIMQTFGLGQTCGQDLIIQEVEQLLKQLRATGSKACDPSTTFQFATANVISKFAYGHRFAYDDEAVAKLIEDMRNCLQSLKYGSLSMFFPIINKIPFLSGKQFFAYFDLLRERQREEMSRHKSTIDRNNPRDYIDHYLMEIENESKKKPAPERNFTEVNLEIHLVDLFMAGTETTSSAMTWCLLMLVLHPDIQIKVQQELDSAIPKAQTFITMEDFSRCPYIQAVIHETLRFATIAPVALRNSTADVEINNYRLPKDTSFMIHYLSIHYDSKLWDNPDEFKPERFLSKQQPPTLVKHDYLMAFSTGRRNCLGERLARAELFLFLANIFKTFNIRLPHGNPLPSAKPNDGFTRTPKPYKICFIPRLQETHVVTDNAEDQ